MQVSTGMKWMSDPVLEHGKPEEIVRGAASYDEDMTGGLPPSATAVNLNSIAQVALLLERSLRAQKEAADRRRDAFEQSQGREEKKAVLAMRREADAIWSGALASGALSVAGGLTQVAGAGMKLAASSLEARASALEVAASDPKVDRGSFVANARRVAARGVSLSHQAQVVASAGELLSSSASGPKGLFDAQAKQRAADQAEHRRLAESNARSAKRVADMAAEVGELGQKVLTRLEQILEDEHRTRMAVLNRV